MKENTKKVKYIKFLHKLGVFLVLTLLFITSSTFIYFFTVDKKKRLKKLVKNSNFYRDLALKLFNVKVYINNFNLNTEENYLITPNHLSYLDILVLKNNDKNLFVSTHEVKETFLFGKVAEFGGSVFINRQSKNGIKQEIETLKEVLKEGFSIVIFLEGTTSNGETVLPFKSSFVEIAFELGVKIVPTCIRYRTVNGEKLSEKNRDLIFYYGDMNLFKHVFNFLLNVNSVEVEVIFLNPVNPSDFKDRKELSKYLHSEILKCYTG